MADFADSDSWRQRSLAVLREVLSDQPFDQLDLQLFNEREEWSTPHLASVRTQVFKVWRLLGLFDVVHDAAGGLQAWSCPEREKVPENDDGLWGDGLAIARRVLPEGARYVRAENLKTGPAHLLDLVYAEGKDQIVVRVNLAHRQVVSLERTRRD